MLDACDECSTSDSMCTLHGGMVEFNVYRHNLLRRSLANLLR